MRERTAEPTERDAARATADGAVRRRWRLRTLRRRERDEVFVLDDAGTVVPLAFELTDKPLEECGIPSEVVVLLL